MSQRFFSVRGLVLAGFLTAALPGSTLALPVSDPVGLPIWGASISYNHQAVPFDPVLGGRTLVEGGDNQIGALLNFTYSGCSPIFQAPGCDVASGGFGGVAGLPSASFAFSQGDLGIYGGSSQIQLYDVLFIDVPGASDSALTTITMSHRLTGNAVSVGRQFQIHDNFQFGTFHNSTIEEIVAAQFGDTNIVDVTPVGLQGNFVNPDNPNVNPDLGIWPWIGHYDVSWQVTVQGSRAIIPFSNIATTTTLDSTVVFLQTGTFSLDLPSGVVVRSASGVLLTQATEVSEPASLGLLGAGLLGLAALRRRARSRNATM